MPFKTELGFAPNTSADSQKLIQRMHTPASILEAYRRAKEQFGTYDIVLACSDQVGHIEYMTRQTYCAHLKTLYGEKASVFRLWHVSAQSHMQLPRDSDAMWFVVDIKGVDLPTMCVVFAVPSAVEELAEMN